MNRTVRVVQAVVAGVLVAAGIGLGAYNAWWVALVLSIPLIVGGLLVMPRPSRVADLTPFPSQRTRRSVPVRVDAITRSTFDDDDLQPTLVTATVAPPHDTEYQVRWITSMSRSDFRVLTAEPVTALAPEHLPVRDAGHTPTFDDHPGRWSAIYPVIVIVVVLAVLFGVGSAWRVSFDRPAAPKPAASAPPAGSGSKAMELNARRDGMMRAITEKLGPAATDNLLNLRFTDSGSDYGTVLDTTNGDVQIVYVNNGGNAIVTPSAQVLRRDSTFVAADIAATDLDAMVEKMARQADSAGRRANLEIERTGPGGPVMLTGTFGARHVNGLPDGTVGEKFDPADFAVSFAKARAALAQAGIGPADRVLTNFEIRGVHRATPHARPTEVQTYGGVQLDFNTGDRKGLILVTPGELPEVRDDSSWSAAQPFAFDDISLEAFESVRAQSMQRGALEPYERDAVDIWQVDREIDGHGLAIRVTMAGVEAASGTYSLSGEFLSPGARP